MVDSIASKMIFTFMESQDKLDTVGRIHGHDSKEYDQALDEHSKLFFEMRNLIALGLQKEEENKNGNV